MGSVVEIMTIMECIVRKCGKSRITVNKECGAAEALWSQRHPFRK